MKILEHKQILQKIKRLSHEIVENNYDEQELVIIGINERGQKFANYIVQEIKQISSLDITIGNISISPEAPLDNPINLTLSQEELVHKSILIIDDVANTGRTIFYAFSPFMNIPTKKIEVAVLVDRKHKSFPIKVDYVGLSLATTLMENIDVHILNQEKIEVELN